MSLKNNYMKSQMCIVYASDLVIFLYNCRPQDNKDIMNNTHHNEGSLIATLFQLWLQLGNPTLATNHVFLRQQSGLRLQLWR